MGPGSSRQENDSNGKKVNFIECCPEAPLHKDRDMTTGFDSMEFAKDPGMQFQRSSRDGAAKSWLK